MSPVKVLLRERSFRRFMAASTFTALAFGTSRFVFVWAMGDLTDWEPALGLLGVALGVPALVFSPIFGNLADRHDRRWVAAISSVAVGFGCVGAALLLALDALDPVSLGAAAFLLAIPLAGVAPAVQAMVPSLADRSLLMNAVALQNLSMMGSMVVGAFLGGAVITAAGTDVAFGVMAVVSLAAAVQLVTLPVVAGGRVEPDGSPVVDVVPDDGAEPPAVGMAEGLAHARRDPIVGIVLLMGGCLGLGTAASFLFMPQLARDSLGASAFGAGLLNASMSLGLIITAGFLASRVNLDRPVRLMAWVFALVGGPGVVAIGISPVYAVALLATFCWGMGGGIVVTLQRTTLQRRTPDHLMGRIMGLFALANFGTFPVAALLTFGLAQVVGVRGVFVTLGTAMTCIIVVLSSRILRHEAREHAEQLPAPVSG